MDSVVPDFSCCRFSALADLSPAEEEALAELGGPVRNMPAGQVIRSEAQEEPAIFFLHHGWVASSATVADGGRQILKVHMPGDVMGTPSLPYMHAVETLTTLTEARLSIVALDRLGDLFCRMPRLGALMFLTAQQERLTLMDRLSSMGRLDARSSIAALLVHLHDRLRLTDGAHPSAFHLPLSQQQIGDVLGLTSVHVNRVLRQLEEDGYIRRIGRTFDLVDVVRLREVSGMPERTLRRNAAWLPPAA